MKPLLITLLTLTISIGNTIAQELHYKEIKKEYSWKDYRKSVDDPTYKIWVAGLSSAIVPGVGQMYTGEMQRGALFMGGSMASSGLFWGGYYLGMARLNGMPVDLSVIKFMVITGVISQVGLKVWSSADAIRIAKVKNYAYEVNQSRSMNLRVLPDLNLIPSMENSYTTNIGTRLCLNF